ncbi:MULTISPECIES: LLM class flavin-dependent oxidoreductase [Microbacterium]|uniref:LLM class flavin-dependent oxidoreductase n=1 Tax=Microbacterium TaxID=33882 RepID=UPI001D173197|nr:LLM class flavin-dependent oxidoreductase [Microbacterium testaceum]MCC4250682.1 LLM class flavin-dependent oxidoreductase [Microbacterium testaceum]
MQFWLHGFPTLGGSAGWAADAEGLGYDGVLLADSEMLVPDPYVELGLIATATERIGMGVAVTNPVSRHPAVTASAILTVHAESGGRAVLGLARGDSALRQLGLAPPGVTAFTAALQEIQGHLGAPGLPHAAPLAWLPANLSKVPVDVAATGPRMIDVGAVGADRLTFNLGADVDRLTWAVNRARDARRAAGLDPAGISLGAYVDVACADDEADALRIVRGSASIFAQLLAEGASSGVPDIPAADRQTLAGVASAYDEAQHGTSGSPQARAGILPDEFLARFALCGTPAQLVERVRALAGLGLQRLVVVPASRDVDATTTRETVTRFAREVIPGL